MGTYLIIPAAVLLIVALGVFLKKKEEAFESSED